MTLRPRDVVYVFHFIAMKQVPSYIPAIFVRCVTVAPTTNNRHNNKQHSFHHHQRHQLSRHRHYKWSKEIRIKIIIEGNFIALHHNSGLAFLRVRVLYRK